MVKSGRGNGRFVYAHLRSLYGRVRHGVTLGVRGIVLSDRGVLLVRHGYLPGWHLPGGAVDPGESAAEAVLREVEEETGIALDSPPEFVALYFHQAFANRDHVAVFRSRPGQWHRVREIAPSFEIRDAQFFDFDELPEDTSQATRQRIAEALGQKPIDSDRW